MWSNHTISQGNNAKKEVWGEGYKDGTNLWKGVNKKGKEGLYKIEGLETQPTKSFVCVASFWVTS